MLDPRWPHQYGHRALLRAEQYCAGGTEFVENPQLLLIAQSDIAVLGCLGEVLQHHLQRLGGDQAQGGLVKVNRLRKGGEVKPRNQSIHAVLPTLMGKKTARACGPASFQWSCRQLTSGR